MAWIEMRDRQHRVYWYNHPGLSPQKVYEAFASEQDAQRFLTLISRLDGNPWAARDYIHRGDDPQNDPDRPGSLRLDTLRDAYLESRASRTYDRTRQDYRRDIDRYLIGYFGADFDVTTLVPRRPMLTPRSRRRCDVNGWLAWMSQQQACTSHGVAKGHPITAKTIRNVHGTLFAMMKLAVADPSVPVHGNPCADSPLPPLEPGEMRFLEKSEFAALLQFFSSFYRPLVLTLVMTGIRWGEAAGLQRKNLHLDAPVPYVYVCKALRRPHKGAPVLGRPKTRESVRRVSLNPLLVEMLRAHTAELQGNDFVFRMSGGGVLHSGNFYEREWKPALQSAVDESILSDAALRVHDLRHTNAAWLISAGRPLLTVKRRLGHASIITTNRYSHLTSEVDPADLAVLDDAFPELVAVAAHDCEPLEPTASPTEMDEAECDLPVLHIDDADDVAA